MATYYKYPYLYEDGNMVARGAFRHDAEDEFEEAERDMVEREAYEYLADTADF